MPEAVAVPVFLLGAVFSIGASWVLVSRLERLGWRLGLSGALLGVVAAVAADAPEITAAISALASREHSVGVGVVIGSNVFNLAALLGLGAIVAGRIALHRRVIVLSGAMATWLAAVCMATVVGALPIGIALVLALAVLAPYIGLLASNPRHLRLLPLPRPWIRWLVRSIHEEELELGVPHEAADPGIRDWSTALASVAVVVGASVVMERAAVALGQHHAVPGIVVGGFVLAGVTSLPNAVAAIYLAARGRGSAVLSTALSSNAFNVALGLLLPAAVVGLGSPSPHATLIATWYLGLTAFALAFAYRERGLGRDHGLLILGAYGVFLYSLLATAQAGAVDPRFAIALALATAVVLTSRLLVKRGETRRRPAARRPRAAERQESLLPGWSVNRLWGLSLGMTSVIAVLDAVLGPQIVLIGFLLVGPCCAFLTGRWLPTVVTSGWAVLVGVALGLADGIWGTATHLAFLAVLVAVAALSTAAAIFTDRRRAGGPP